MSTLYVWLAALGLEQYAAVFAENDIDLEVLPELSEKDLAELGVSLGHRKKILKTIAEAVPVPVMAAIPTMPVGLEAPDPRSYTPKHLIDKILQSRSALEGERKQVTVLFADVKGSIELAEQLDPEQWHQILDRFFQILSEGVHRFEGTVNQYTGDGIMALFGAPIAHEDHAQRACYAALYLRDELARYASDLKRTQGLSFSIRMGLNSGEVVVGRIGNDLRMDYTAQGHTVGRAQRMESLAEPNTCYVSAETATLVGGYFALDDLGEFQVKGVSTSMRVHRLAGPGASRTRFEVSRARGLSRFVGRVDESRTLSAALERAREGHGQVVGVVGEAGVGKSRLCHEFVEACRQQGVPVYQGHCPAHGRNIPFIPILELYRNYFGITAQDNPAQARQKIAGALVLLDPALQEALPVLFEFMGVADPDHPGPALDADARQRRLFALLRQVYRIQAERGVATVILIDDAHWIDSASDAFIAQFVEATEQSRNLLLLNFRPEYTAPWMRRANYHQLPLVPLALEAIKELLESLLGADASLGDLVQRIMRWTSGNPFYTEELVRELVEARALIDTSGAYRLMTDVDALQIPSNVRAVLAARIDRLGEREKQVLQAAAVIGKDFAEPILRRTVAELDDAPLTEAELGAICSRLTDGEFLYAQALYPVAEYAFKHPLTHEVALGSQLQERRRRTHAAVANALEDVHVDRLDESAALIAHHHESAGETLVAARWHRRAAQWAGLKDIMAALHHWHRVRELARRGDDKAEAAALTIAGCSEALIHGWRAGASATTWAALFEEGCAAAEGVGDLRALAMLNAAYSAVRALNQGIAPDYVRYSKTAVAIAERTGDTALRCATRSFLMFGYVYCGELREAERVSDEIIQIADDNPHLGANAVGFSSLLAARGLRNWCIGFSRDSSACAQEFARVRQRALENGYPEQALWAMCREAELKWALRSFDGARALAQDTTRLAENLGVGNQMQAALAPCFALAGEGEWQASLDLATDTLRLIRERGALRLFEPSFLAHIGLAELELGNLDAGRAAAAEGVAFMREAKCALHPHAYAVLARAQLALHEPASDIADTLDEYAALLERTEYHLHEGELYELRAHLAEREGHEPNRTAALQRAHDCYTRFGMSAPAARVARAIG